MTYSAVQPLASGDKLDFRVFQKNPDGFCARLYFEFNIVKLSSTNEKFFNPAPTLGPIGPLGSIAS